MALTEDSSNHETNVSQQNEQINQRWKWSVIFLCFYGFIVQIKPGESFITPFLLSFEKNFTKEQVTNEITPVLSYSYMAVLVPVFLLTDFLRYKPVLILQSLSHISIWLILLFGTNLLEMQFMEFFYGITMAARVAYSSYIFSLVTPSLYQRVASYSRSSVLMGVFISSVLGQMFVSIGEFTYITLSKISLGFVVFSFLLALFLPWPKRSMFFNRKVLEQNIALPTEIEKEGSNNLVSSPSRTTASWKNSTLFEMLKELVNVVRKPQLRLWSIWWILNSTGYYLIIYYVQILWNEVYPAIENRKVYNGGVDAASTLLGAITSFAAGYVKIRWFLWSELVIAIITTVQAGLLLLMNTTSNIWVCYIAYVLFRGFYQFLVPIAIFQIASSLSKELCALVFGVNTFLSTVLKTIITIIVADKSVLGLAVHPQFFVYFGYFTLLCLGYFAAAAFNIIKHFRRNSLPETPNGNKSEKLCNVVSDTPEEQKPLDEAVLFTSTKAI
ncbi:reduced folate transporter [Polypterus senegalus]|uniref:reduced folate transporter n=1 Tax=Polypterus senegalus TaxID=55291 RepID=UPI001964BAC7|nr:reduced folate transporter [Polypterus senegalus]